MEDFKLPKVVTRRGKRQGQGIGSGKGGHTSGRGQKGQKARGRIPVLFEGTKVKKSLLKRLPFLRGRGRFSRKSLRPIIVNFSDLNKLPSGRVNEETLIKSNLLTKEEFEIFGIKILGNGEITKKFNIEVPISKSAAKKIEELGGTIVDKSK